MPLSANLFQLESLILTRAKLTTNRNNVATEKQSKKKKIGGILVGGILTGNREKYICMKQIHNNYYYSRYDFKLQISSENLSENTSWLMTHKFFFVSSIFLRTNSYFCLFFEEATFTFILLVEDVLKSYISNEIFLVAISIQLLSSLQCPYKRVQPQESIHSFIHSSSSSRMF